MKDLPPSDRASVRRLPQRGAYDKETVYAILDEGLVCHVGLAVEGSPVVIPMAYARAGDRLLLHGFAGGRLIRAMQGGAEVAVAVTHLDALVLARSAFHHSMNYRSVVVFARARAIQGDEAKREALREFFEHVVPGRWDAIRKPSAHELAQTALVEIPLAEASAKIRSGPPVDEEADYALDVWAGLVPMETHAGRPVPDPRLETEIAPPALPERHRRGRK